jgi:hypothetical protein
MYSIVLYIEYMDNRQCKFHFFLLIFIYKLLLYIKMNNLSNIMLSYDFSLSFPPNDIYFETYNIYDYIGISCDKSNITVYDIIKKYLEILYKNVKIDNYTYDCIIDDYILQNYKIRHIIFNSTYNNDENVVEILDKIYNKKYNGLLYDDDNYNKMISDCNWYKFHLESSNKFSYITHIIYRNKIFLFDSEQDIEMCISNIKKIFKNILFDNIKINNIPMNNSMKNKKLKDICKSNDILKIKNFT